MDLFVPISSELCRSLKYTEQTFLEIDASMGYRKPPRKEKKKLSSTFASILMIMIKLINKRHMCSAYFHFRF